MFSISSDIIYYSNNEWYSIQSFTEVIRLKYELNDFVRWEYTDVRRLITYIFVAFSIFNCSSNNYFATL